MDPKRLRELFNMPGFDADLRARLFTTGGAPRWYRPVSTFTVSDGAGDASGEFEAVVAVFNTPTSPDFFGDTVTFMPGAFRSALAAADAAHPIPVFYSHLWGNLPLGPVLSASETKEGLQVRARLDIAGNSNRGEMARGVIDAMRDRTLREFSFGAMLDWDTAEYEDILDDKGQPVIGAFGDRAQNVKMYNVLDLLEVGPTLRGRHPDTRLINVHSAQPRRIETQQTQAPRGDEVATVIERAKRLHRWGL